jgi:D-arabinitol dehydrogenase (NADP+)
MQALQYTRPKSLRLVELPDPEPAEDQVLVQIIASGICGTDLHILAGEAFSASPVVLGHEFTGKVIKAGSKAAELTPGTIVAIDPNNHCDHCEYCLRGDVHLCRNIRPAGISYNGGWAELCVVPAIQVHPVPVHLDPRLAALAEPLSCVIHGWDRIAPAGPDRSVLIMGAGLIGLLWALLLKMNGLIDLHITEPQHNRRDAAHRLGFSCMSPGALVAKFDIVIDCSGSPAAIEKAQDHLKPGGRLLLFGVAPDNARISISPYRIFQNEWTVMGSVINPFTFSRALTLLPALGLSLSDLGVVTFPLPEYEQALKTARSGAATKILFDLRRVG